MSGTLTAPFSLETHSKAYVSWVIGSQNSNQSEKVTVGMDLVKPKSSSNKEIVSYYEPSTVWDVFDSEEQSYLARKRRYTEHWGINKPLILKEN